MTTPRKSPSTTYPYFHTLAVIALICGLAILLFEDNNELALAFIAISTGFGAHARLDKAGIE